MFKQLSTLFKGKKSKNNGSNDGEETPTGFISTVPDVKEFISQHKLNCKARTLSELIAWLDSKPGQKWYVTKASKKKASLRTVGVYEEFPDLEIASSWLLDYGGGKYYVKPLSLGKVKIGYYEFEGEDKEPEEDEETVKSKKLKLKYKPKDFKEAVLLQRLEDGDEQLIQKIAESELNKQGIKDDEKACIVSPGVDIKDHFNEIENLKDKFSKEIGKLKDELHEKDMKLIEERFKKGEKSSGWDAFVRMLETDTGKELAGEALDTIKEIFKTTNSSGKDDVEVEKFEDFKEKSLPPAKEQAKKEKHRRDFTPLKIMLKFIENDGGPSAYLEAMSVSYPEHPFCQTLITCETADQFLAKLKSLEQKLPILFGDKGKTWLDELFTTIKEFKEEKEHEPGTETESAAVSSAAPESDEDALSQH